jgi:hypothetical protein
MFPERETRNTVRYSPHPPSQAALKNFLLALQGIVTAMTGISGSKHQHQLQVKKGAVRLERHSGEERLQPLLHGAF